MSDSAKSVAATGGPPGPQRAAPIFVVGTGRCGSTFIQTSLSATGRIWVWGEHAGMLRGLFQWSREMRANSQLRRFVFPFADADPMHLLEERPSRPGWEPSWLNSFGPADFDELERLAIRHFVARRLPAGKTRWGFKEIRYGEEDGVLERLLELYPRARLVHVVRHPIDTVESMLAAWSAEHLDRAVAEGALEPVMRRYRDGLQRWARITQRLLALTRAHPAARSFRIEDGEPMLRAMAGFLRIDQAEFVAAAGRSGVRYGHVRTAALRAADPREPIFQQGRATYAELAAPLAAELRYDMAISPRQGTWRPGRRPGPALTQPGETA